MHGSIEESNLLVKQGLIPCVKRACLFLLIYLLYRLQRCEAVRCIGSSGGSWNGGHSKPDQMDRWVIHSMNWMTYSANEKQVTIFLFCFSPEQSHLDPNDPANADIMNIAKVILCEPNCSGLQLTSLPGSFLWPKIQGSGPGNEVELLVLFSSLFFLGG